MEFNLVIRQRNRRAILILGLQQVLHLHVTLRNPVTDSHGNVADLHVEDADRIGRKDNFHLVKLHGRVFVVRYQNPLVVPRLGAVDEGAELRNPACTLEVPKVV